MAKNDFDCTTLTPEQRDARLALDVERLLRFGRKHKLIKELDAIVARNTLLDLLGLAQPSEEKVPKEDFDTPAALLDEMVELAAAKGLFLLTMKPILYVANVDEDMLNDDLAPIDGVKPLPICAKIEAELSELDPEDAADYLESLGLEQPGLDVLAQAAYKLLGLQSFFTAGEMEVKAWTVRQGATAPQAAGVIHTDFERGFIKAEVIGYDDYIELGGEQGAKAAGKLRIEGKDYVMADGDVVHFRFNV